MIFTQLMYCKIWKELMKKRPWVSPSRLSMAGFAKVVGSATGVTARSQHDARRTSHFRRDKDIFNVSQMSSNSIVLSQNNLLASLIFGWLRSIAGRPPIRPRALAAASPAFVLSWISRRSNWARAENMLRTNSPDADVVSICHSLQQFCVLSRLWSCRL